MSIYGQAAKKVLGKLLAARGGGGENDHLTLNAWEWPQGVALYAMTKVYDLSHDENLLKWMIAWYARRIGGGLPVKNVNTVAPMLALTRLREYTGDASYDPLIAEWAAWIMRDMPRTREGGLQHITTHDVNEQQLWDDTLFMTVLFLYRAGMLLGREEWKKEAEYQFLLHIKYLYDPKTSLLYHGWSFIGRHHFAGAFWARGNSWFTAGGVEFLSMLPESPTRRFVLETWRAQCLALCRLQDGGGLWHTLLDDGDSYLETSASAAVAYGLLRGARLGLLPDECRACAEKALFGVLGQVDEDGTVLGVSYGTPMGSTLDFYRSIDIRPTAYGQGLTFLMLTEVMDGESIL